VAFETTLGSFTVELNSEQAPVTVKNFLRYVEDGSYVGSIFHRVIPGFMLQGG
jgi:peptidyl-prolyl cis-trans isomerase A (cyclophilin A)